MRTNLKWREWRGLHGVYEQGSSAARIKQHPYVVYLLGRGLLKTSPRNPQRILATPEFYDYYKSRHLEKYRRYDEFLGELANPSSTYTEDDIGALMIIKENRERIVEKGRTQRSLSADLFGDSKHIEKRPGLQKAILKLLELENFPGQDPKDQWYIYVVPCKTPKAVVLCENLDFLRIPWQARKHKIELWYAGGSNTAKLGYIPELALPIYYSCDWDYHGLSIYQRIKGYIPGLRLLYPATTVTKPVDAQNHESQWRHDIPFSGLDEKVYSRRAKALIEKLIIQNWWIEEENNVFDELVEVNSIGTAAVA